jgi:hypothetical protein
MNEIIQKPGSLRLNSQLDYILVDGSGSMRDKWWPTLDAIEAYVQSLKGQNIGTQTILSVFDSIDKDLIQRNAPIAEWKSLREAPIGAHWGMTPLYDAITLMGARLRDLDPPRASILLVTDGNENTSSFTSAEQAKGILDWCRAKGWQITFIGANFNNRLQGKALGATEANAIGVQTHMLADATKALAAKRARYGLYGEPMHYTEDERQQFGGFLAGPSND